MTSPLDQRRAAAKTGAETFHAGGADADFTLLDFWRWAESDLLNNTRRGIVAEFLVARAVGAASEPRVEWADVDARTPGGARIEVKSAAYVQGWKQDRPSPIRFDIAPRSSSWDPQAGEVITHDPPARVADVYVLCLLGSRPDYVPDPLNLDDWRFHVVATSVLDRELPGQKNVGLRRLEAVMNQTASRTAVGFTDLRRAIEIAADEHRTDSSVGHRR